MDTNDTPKPVDVYLASLDPSDEDALRIIAAELAHQKQYVGEVPKTLGGLTMDDGRAEALRYVIALRLLAKADSPGWKCLMKFVSS